MWNGQWGVVSASKADFRNYNEMQPHRIDLSNLSARMCSTKCNWHWRPPYKPNHPTVHLTSTLSDRSHRHELHAKCQKAQKQYSARSQQMFKYIVEILRPLANIFWLPPVNQIAQRIRNSRPLPVRQRLALLWIKGNEFLFQRSCF